MKHVELAWRYVPFAIPKDGFRTSRAKLLMICGIFMNPHPQSVSGLRKGMVGRIKRSTNEERQRTDSSLTLRLMNFGRRPSGIYTTRFVTMGRAYSRRGFVAEHDDHHLARILFSKPNQRRLNQKEKVRARH
jgi:hypothetical protein